MIARIAFLALALGLVTALAPGPFGTVEDASAYCIHVDEFGCINPCHAVVSPYNTARRTAGLEDETPTLYCLE